MSKFYEMIGRTVVTVATIKGVMFGVGLIENAIEKRRRKKASKEAGVIDIEVVQKERAK